jgi:hypothetical protein
MRPAVLKGWLGVVVAIVKREREGKGSYQVLRG